MTLSATTVIKRLLLLFLVIAGMYFARAFLIPLAIGMVLATLFLPVCHWLERHRVPRSLAVALCMLVILIFISGIFTLIGWQVSSLTNDFALIKDKSVSAIDSLQQYIYTNLGISAEEQSEILKDEKPSVSAMARIIAGSLSSVITGVVFMLVYVFLFLYYRVHIKQFILLLTPADQREQTEHLIHKATRVSQQYLVGLAKMIFCLWIMYGIGFSLLGVKNAIFYAILCGLLEIVPFIGNITGTTITVVAAAVQGSSYPILGGIVATYIVVQLIQGWILEPLILGPQVRINPLFTIIALIVGELIWGIPGIILAIPLIAMFKIVCDHIEPLKPYGFLIGEIEMEKDDPGYIKRIKNWISRRRAA
jgi:predicted PurR-regulated permease PerM